MNSNTIRSTTRIVVYTVVYPMADKILVQLRVSPPFSLVSYADSSRLCSNRPLVCHPISTRLRIQQTIPISRTLKSYFQHHFNGKPLPFQSFDIIWNNGGKAEPLSPSPRTSTSLQGTITNVPVSGSIRVRAWQKWSVFIYYGYESPILTRVVTWVPYATHEGTVKLELSRIVSK